MEDLALKYKELQSSLQKDLDSINLVGLEKKLQSFQLQQDSPDFWLNQNNAQAVSKEISKIQNRIEPWQKLNSGVKDSLELIAMDDTSILKDLQKNIVKLEADYQSLKQELLYSGKYDDHDAILSIYAGAGGTDAQDWAEMLQRMYLRFVEQNKGFEPKIIDISAGEEAGIKSVTIEISGPMAYGKLKSEHGVHRLVRLSPFNSDNLRQTSFAKVDVLPKIDAPEEVVVDEKDLKVDVYRAGGHGGQSVNTTDSAVRITHIPTGITVAIQNERSQLQNKETAMTILRSRLAQLQIEQHQESLRDLKGPNEQAAWGNQIRNYVLHPYSMVKDVRTKQETSNVQDVLDGNLNDFINAYLNWIINKT
ncbi:peptide chain release factor 2 [Candidatus Saccharibacteria bacterium]|nr:peptide chain release factor 2 [Candidatus Saccharibacteria bacterium]